VMCCPGFRSLRVKFGSIASPLFNCKHQSKQIIK
jgi:hypothetical protein